MLRSISLGIEMNVHFTRFTFWNGSSSIPISFKHTRPPKFYSVIFPSILRLHRFQWACIHFVNCFDFVISIFICSFVDVVIVVILTFYFGKRTSIKCDRNTHMHTHTQAPIVYTQNKHISIHHSKFIFWTTERCLPASKNNFNSSPPNQPLCSFEKKN